MGRRTVAGCRYPRNRATHQLGGSRGCQSCRSNTPVDLSRCAATTQTPAHLALPQCRWPPYLWGCTNGALGLLTGRQRAYISWHTEAGTPDVALPAPIQAALAERALLPSEQVVDSGYVDAALLVESRMAYNIDLIGPVHANTSWQAQEDRCFETAHFALDWERQIATCPQGKTSVQWMPVRDSDRRAVISIRFCAGGLAGLLCAWPLHVGEKSGRRSSRCGLKPSTKPCKQLANTKRRNPSNRSMPSVPGLRALGRRGYHIAGLRQARYVGRPNTHLQVVATAVALNVVRLVAWLEDQPGAKTRPLALCSSGAGELANQSGGGFRQHYHISYAHFPPRSSQQHYLNSIL